MIRIDFSRTFMKIRAEAEQHNRKHIGTKIDKAGRVRDDLSQMIRQPQQNLMREIMRCYAAQINSQQRHHPDALKYAMPPLKINNKALATLTGESRMNVYRHINRLVNAGMVKRGKWGGTNGDYELIINTDCLYLLQNGHPVLPASIKNGLFTQAENQEVVHSNITGCDHKEAGNMINKLTKAEKIVENRGNTQHIGQVVSTISRTIDFAGNTKEQDASSAEMPPPPFAPAPPSERPEHIGLLAWGRMNKYVGMIINLMIGTLWRRLPYLAASELEIARNYIYSLFLAVEPEQYKALFNELNFRTIIIARYLNRDGKRFVPIPSTFFNPESKFNFQRSKLFYEEHRKNKRKLKELEGDYGEFIQRWNDYMKAVNHYLRDGSFESYKKGDAFLRKKYPELADAYRYLIINKLNNQIQQPAA